MGWGVVADGWAECLSVAGPPDLSLLPWKVGALCILSFKVILSLSEMFRYRLYPGILHVNASFFPPVLRCLRDLLSGEGRRGTTLVKRAEDRQEQNRPE